MAVFEHDDVKIRNIERYARYSTVKHTELGPLHACNVIMG